ncbi:MAG: dephospho-CoA kinase [Acidimicrobiia bacterium]|nr:dephospho-CoA kinase [Acidimicrobiia bacterium]
MLVVGLTGGIGAGKSTVSRLLADRGAVIVDADLIAREVVEPGGPAYQGVVDRFGSAVVLADGQLDRPALAEIVFSDPDALKDLNAVVHPAVGVVIAERLAEESATDHVVILDVPLLVESGRGDMAGTIVVDCPPEEALRRAVARGLPEDDVRRRMANQVTREERLAKADFVVDNSGGESALPAEVDKAWTWIQALADRAPSGN